MVDNGPYVLYLAVCSSYERLALFQESRKMKAQTAEVEIKTREVSQVERQMREFTANVEALCMARARVDLLL